jgi:hypothetical protein
MEVTMNIPFTQFYLFIINDHPHVFQTFEAALNQACHMAHSTEFIDLDPDNKCDIKLYFPKTDETITIGRKLFTYKPFISLAIPNYDHSEPKQYDFRNIG